MQPTSMSARPLEVFTPDHHLSLLFSVPLNVRKSFAGRLYIHTYCQSRGLSSSKDAFDLSRPVRNSDSCRLSDFAPATSTPIMVTTFSSPVLSVAVDAVRDLEGKDALGGLWNCELTPSL